MAYIRLTLARPRPDVREEVRQHYEDLVRHVSSLPGCIQAYVIESHDESAEIGRISIWESADAANRAANDPHAMSLHAALHFDVQGSLYDRSFDASDPPASR